MAPTRRRRGRNPGTPPIICDDDQGQVTAANRVIKRTGGVELDHDTRALIGRLITAHDDPAIDLTAFVHLAREYSRTLLILPERERVEAGLQLAEHALRKVTYRNDLTVVGIEIEP